MRNFLGLEKLSGASIARNLALIAIGSLISAVGINAFLVPHRFIAGGVFGVAQLISYFTPISIGTLVLGLNIPIFIFGLRYAGRVFVVGSLAGVAAVSICLNATAWMSHMGWAPERFLAAVIGGVLAGAGTGLVFRANSSHGGTDIIAAAVKRRWSIGIGTVAFLSNALIIFALGFIYGLDAALYTIVAQFCVSMAIDRTMMGLDTARAIFVITSEPQKIADLILKKLNRGVTFLDGEGAYLGRHQRVLYCVVSLSQLARVKHYVQSIDPNAFLTVAEVSEIMGKGFKSVPI